MDSNPQALSFYSPKQWFSDPMGPSLDRTHHKNNPDQRIQDIQYLAFFI